MPATRTRTSWRVAMYSLTNFFLITCSIPRRTGGPDADRTGFLVGGKGLPEHGKAVGQDQCFTQALQKPADDKRRETGRETNRGRAQAIQSDPREEDPLLSEPVTQSASDQGQGRER